MKYLLSLIYKTNQVCARYYSTILLGVIGVLLAYATFFTVNYYEEKQAAHTLKTSFEDKVTSLTQAISAINKVFIAAQSLLEISPTLSQANFAQLITPDFLANTGMNGVEWAPAIRKEQRQNFQTMVRNQGIFDYKIREMNASNISCSGDSKYIFPVLFSEPADNIGHELGLLLSSDCATSASMEIARKSQSISGTNFYNEQDELGFKLLLPLFNQENGELRGYIVGIVMINNLIDTLWGEITSSDKYQLLIHNRGEKGQLIYNSQWRESCQSDCLINQSTTKLEAAIPFANQVWSIEIIKYGEESLGKFYAYIVATLILLLTLGLGVYLWMNLNRVRWANNLVLERTESLRYQATHDDLTRLLNKKSLSAKLEKINSPDNSLHHTGFSLLFIDLDHFKKVNDTKGHLVGDKLLKQVAQRLQRSARNDDDIFRFGGDEFAVILHNNNNIEKVKLVAERIQKDLENIYVIDNNKYRIGASIGISVINSPQLNVSEIIRNADIAMYEAKRMGRGKIIFYRSDMYQSLVYKQGIEDELADAIKNQQLSIHLQPIHDKQRLKGFEALSRWNHPKKGMIFPDQFISVAEETGLIHLLGFWLIDSVCLQLKALIECYGVKNTPYISINVSPIQLSQRGIVDYIEHALKQNNIPGHLLAIELTESALIDKKSIVRSNLNDIRALGLSIFLDDFGTGFSSLSLLRDFPIDVLKIDRSFVLGIDDNHQDSQQLVKAMITMADALNMRVVAEGVENIKTLTWLHQENCHSIQGYYFSKPLAPEAVKEYLNKQMLVEVLPDKKAHSPHYEGSFSVLAEA